MGIHRVQYLRDCADVLPVPHQALQPDVACAWCLPGCIFSMSCVQAAIREDAQGERSGQWPAGLAFAVEFRLAMEIQSLMSLVLLLMN